MSDRVNVVGYDELTGRRVLLGHFDLSKVTVSIRESQDWDGNNLRGVISNGQIGYVHLYRTSGGRWVEHRDFTNEYAGGDTWRYLTDAEAAEWLLRDETTKSTETYEQYFGELAEEQGPPQMGRPPVGPTAKVKLPEWLMARVDADADAQSLTRSAMLRRIIENHYQEDHNDQD